MFAFQVRRTRCEDGGWTSLRNVGKFLPKLRGFSTQEALFFKDYRCFVAFNVHVYRRQMLPGAPRILCFSCPLHQLHFDLFASFPNKPTFDTASRPGYGCSDWAVFQTNANVLLRSRPDCLQTTFSSSPHHSTLYAVQLTAWFPSRQN